MKKLLFLLMFVYGCTAHRTEDPHIKYFAARNDLFDRMPLDTSDIVFLGNSITELFPVTELFGSHVKNRGISGNKITDVLHRIGQIIRCRPKKVFLEIGINDLKDGVTVQQSIKAITTLIDTLKHCTRLYVMTLLPVSGQYARLHESVEMFNSYLRVYCDLENVRCIDLNPNVIIETYDGLHPDGKSYIDLANFIKPYVLEK